MQAPVIWHNPRCSKSRETLKLLQDRGIAPKVRLYLEEPPSMAELETVLAELGQPVTTMVRFKESVAKDLGLSAKDLRSDDDWLQILANNPVLIERPIVIANDKAAIGRPPEAVLDILE